MYEIIVKYWAEDTPFVRARHLTLKEAKMWTRRLNKSKTERLFGTYSYREEKAQQPCFPCLLKCTLYACARVYAYAYACTHNRNVKIVKIVKKRICQYVTAYIF